MESDRQPPALEPCYTPQQIAERWQISPDTVRRMFRGEEGVLKLTTRGLTRQRRKVLRIPASVLARIEEERSRGFVSEIKARGRTV